LHLESGRAGGYEEGGDSALTRGRQRGIGNRENDAVFGDRSIRGPDFPLEIFHPSPSATARVAIAAASEPAPGSDNPKHIEASPAFIGARIRLPASSVTRSKNRLGPNAQWLIA